MSNLQTKVKLDGAKFFYQQMEINFQDGTKFLYYLDAFLGSARSVTWVFQKEFNGDNSLMTWYNGKVEEWKNKKIMKFFNEMRTISVKEHTPKMEITRQMYLSANAEIIDMASVEKASPDITIKAEAPPLEPAKSDKGKDETLSYSFQELPEWFDENPNVMDLCRAYLDELGKFVTEVESMIKRRHTEKEET